LVNSGFKTVTDTIGCAGRSSGSLDPHRVCIVVAKHRYPHDLPPLPSKQATVEPDGNAQAGRVSTARPASARATPPIDSHVDTIR